jgi:hypothetical protein
VPRAAHHNATERAGIHRRSVGFVVGSVLVVMLTYVGLQACARQPEANADSFCRQAPALTELDDALASLDAGKIRAALPALRELELAAPPEIHDQVGLLRSLSTELADSLATTDTDATDAAREVWRTHEKDLARIEAAARAVANYTRVTCDLDVAGTTTTVSASPHA